MAFARLPGFTPDLSGLDRLARRLHDAGEQVGAAASAVRGAAPGGDWDGPGSARARDAVRGDAHQVSEAAVAVGEAAREARALAQDARERVDELRLAAAAVRELLP